MNGFTNFDETCRQYSAAPTDGLIRFWRSKVKVIVGRRRGEGIHVDAEASKSVFLFDIKQVDKTQDRK